MDENEYLYIEILGKPGLYSHKPPEAIPPGLYCYHLHDPAGFDFPEIISETVGQDYWATVLLREPLDAPMDKTTELMFGFYEDSGGNPILITTAQYLSGEEPEPISNELGQDEDDLEF